MDRGDVYFMDHLHLFFNKPNLLKMNGIDGVPFTEDFDLRVMDPENRDKKRIEFIIERLRQLFQSFKGGSMSVEEIKKKIQEKISQIKPR